MNETWIPVPDWPDYEVSSFGSIRKNGRPLAPWKNSHGYLIVRLEDGKRRKLSSLNAIVALAFVGRPEEGQQSCHNDGDKGNNRPENLRWDTPSSNIGDSVSHGTHANSAKRCCPLDHPLEGQNLAPSGVRKRRRECLACSRTRAWRSRRARKGIETTPEQFRTHAVTELLSLTY